MFGHHNTEGKIHALVEEGPPYDGKRCVALCGKIVVADADYDGSGFNVRASVDGLDVTCKRCAKIIRSENNRKRINAIISPTTPLGD